MTATALQRVRPRPVGDRAASWEPTGTGYLHPAGFVIVKNRRDWTYGAGAIGAAGYMPMVGWAVFKAGMPPMYHPGVYSGNYLLIADTLRECREWCDQQESA